MNTLHERLGVAVEADAARFSGEEFADAWGGDVAGRVKRRRQVRAAAYSGGTMLAAGALVLGGTKLPWGTLAGPAGVGGVDCVPVSASASDPVPAEAVVTMHDLDTDIPDVVASSRKVDPPTTEVTNGFGFAIEAGDTAERVNLVVIDGSLELADNPSSSTLEARADGTYLVTTPSGARMGISVVDVSENSFEYIMWNELEGGQGFDSGSPVPSPAPSREPSADTAVPSPSPDCVTPTPSPEVAASPSPEPSASWAEPESGSSPFQCGFEFETEVYGTDYISINAPEWLTADVAWARVESRYANPADATESRPFVEVPLVTTTGTGADGIVSAGQLGYIDPADPVDGGLIGASQAYFSQGLTFVETHDGVVTARYDLRELDGLPTPAYVDVAPDGRQVEGMLLDEDRALVSCADADTSGERALYAVAGLGQVWDDGSMEGPFYAWHVIERP